VRPSNPEPTAAVAWKELAAVSAIYAALTFLMALPFSASPASQAVADLPDTHLYIWTLAWDTHAFLHQPFNIFDANIYYPYANTLAYSENLIGTAFFAAPVIWLTGNMVLAMNLVALLTCVLCGIGGYQLGRKLHLSAGAAFICGLVFAFAPPRFFRLGQLHMTAVQWIPFSLAYLHSYFEGGRPRDLRLAVAFFSLQALSSGHGAAYLFVATVCLIAWHVALGAPLALRQRLSDFGVTGAYLLSPSVWIMLPYRLAQQEAGLKRGYLFGAQPGLESFLASPARVDHFLIEELFGTFSKPADAFLFPGLVVLVLAVAGVTFGPPGKLRHNAAAFYATLLVVSTLMFVHWPFELWRYVYWLPGFNFIRVPSRFIILSMLTLGVLAGLGVDRLVARLSLGARTIACVVLSLLLLGEYSAYPFTGVPYRVDIPAIDRWLDTQPKPFVVAEVPVPSSGDLGALVRHQTTSMLHATAHWQKTVHGYSGIQRPLHDQLYQDLNGFPGRASIAALREVGVTHIVVHTEQYGIKWRTVEELIAHSPALHLAHVEGDGRVYTLSPP